MRNYSIRGFEKRRFCIAYVFSLKQMNQKTIKFNVKIHVVFVDYEKVFDKLTGKNSFESYGGITSI